MARDSAEQSERRGRQRGLEDSFTGRSAQLVVVAELLRLHCNAAIPEIDLGTDAFAFQEEREELARLQVKACASPHRYADGSGYSAKFALPLRQLRQPDRPLLYYVLAVLSEGKWIDFLIVSRARLQGYLKAPKKFGSLNKANNDVELTIEFREIVSSSGRNLTDCRNAWHSLPPLQATSEAASTEASGAKPA